MSRIRGPLRVLALLLFAIALPQLASAQKISAPPTTPKKPVVNDYHGVKVTDDYQWLENWNDSAVQKWSNAQNARTRDYLDHLAVYKPVLAWLQKINSASSVSYNSLRQRGQWFFAIKTQPPKNQPFLVAMKSPSDLTAEHVVVDPNQINTKGTTAIDFYVPSLDGRLVAVSLSENGSENGTVHIYDTGTGKEIGDTIPRVNKGTGGGSVAWNQDASGFFYTRYPAPGERPEADMDFYQQVYFHKMGTPVASDVYCVGKEFPRIAETVLHTSEDGHYVLATVANGDGGQFAHYLLDITAGHPDNWTQIARYEDEISTAVFGRDNALYLISTKDAPRGKVLRLPLAKPSLSNAEQIIAQSEMPIEGIVPTSARLYVFFSDGGPSKLRAFDLKGHSKGDVPTLPVSSVFGGIAFHADDLLFENESYLVPGAWFQYEAASGTVSRTAMTQTSPVSFGDAEVVREFATSKDGARIPMSIIRRKGTKLDGNVPTLLTAYGGFGISLSPYYDARLRLWLDAGGVWVVANLRGGGEYGEEWHHAGYRTKKQNVFDDFEACSRYLESSGYSRPGGLAIMGGSNGGLLMGAALVQHPDLYKAVVSFVGIYDMLRNETITANAAYNITEYGSVNDPQQFQALYAYSPYQHVVEHTAYPAVLFLTGANDPRVNPANSRKMTAILQADTSSKAPILLRTSSNSGHGIGSSIDERTRESADMYAFLFAQLGMKMPNEPQRH